STPEPLRRRRVPRIHPIQNRQRPRLRPPRPPRRHPGPTLPHRPRRAHRPRAPKGPRMSAPAATTASPAVALPQAIAAQLAAAPLSVYPIRRLVELADRDTVERILIDWIRDGLLFIDVHVDAVIILDRDRLTAISVEVPHAAQ